MDTVAGLSLFFLKILGIYLYNFQMIIKFARFYARLAERHPIKVASISTGKILTETPFIYV